MRKLIGCLFLALLVGFGFTAAGAGNLQAPTCQMLGPQQGPYAFEYVSNPGTFVNPGYSSSNQCLYLFGSAGGQVFPFAYARWQVYWTARPMAGFNFNDICIQLIWWDTDNNFNVNPHPEQEIGRVCGTENGLIITNYMNYLWGRGKDVYIMWRSMGSYQANSIKIEAWLAVP